MTVTKSQTNNFNLIRVFHSDIKEPAYFVHLWESIPLEITVCCPVVSVSWYRYSFYFIPSACLGMWMRYTLAVGLVCMKKMAELCFFFTVLERFMHAFVEPDEIHTYVICCFWNKFWLPKSLDLIFILCITFCLIFYVLYFV